MDEAKPFGTFALKGFARRAVEFTRTLPDMWLTRRLIVTIRRLVLPRLRGAPVDIEALGVRMRVLPYLNVCEKRMLFNPQTFDPAELAILSGRVGDGFTFIDVGANIGAYSLFVASRAGRGARILAIEPLPDVFERLVANIRLNAFSTIKVVACAIADRTGELTMFIDPRNVGQSSVKLVASGGARPIRVPARKLLDVVREEGFSRIDAMKLDVEGAEDIILGPFLADADEALLPSVLVVGNARERWHVDLETLLTSHGYNLRVATRMNLLFERQPAAALAA